MPSRSPSATCPSGRAGGASGSPPASRLAGGGRTARPSTLRRPALGRGIGGDRLLHFLLRLSSFLVATHLSLGHHSSPRGVRTPSRRSRPLSSALRVRSAGLGG